MASRLGLLGSLVVVVCACQKGRDEVASTSSASGTGTFASANGSGGSGGGGQGGAGVTTSTGPGSGGSSPSTSSGGDGGDATGAGGAHATTSTSSGSTPETCGEEVACWGDEESLCSFGICGDLFIQCAPDDPSAFARACGNYALILREGIWAHFVDCMRAAGPKVECADGEAAVEACLDQASTEACGSDELDAICDGAEASCPGFDVDTCRAELPLILQEGVDYYAGCVDDGGDCATLHNVCYYGTPDP